MVGYGTEVRKPESGPQKPQPMTYPLIRRYTTSPGQKLTPQILQLNGNPNDIRGGGGTCFGDSGGPVFLNGYLVAVTSYGYTANCRYLGGYQRVDIPVVQELAGQRRAAVRRLRSPRRRTRLVPGPRRCRRGGRRGGSARSPISPRGGGGCQSQCSSRLAACSARPIRGPSCDEGQLLALIGTDGACFSS